MRAAWLNDTIVDTNWFETLMALVILLGAVMTGLQLEYQSYYSSHPTAAVNIVDQTVVYLFCVECLVRIAAEGSAWWRYFIGHSFRAGVGVGGFGVVGVWDSRGRWNCFDFLVSWVSFAFLFSDSGAASGAISTVRLLRIVRLLSLMTRFEELTVILRG